MSVRAPAGLPEEIRQRFIAVEAEVKKIIDDAVESELHSDLPNPVQFDMQGSGLPKYLITDDERAQSISFITRYEHLPADAPIRISLADGKYHLGNLPYLRLVLNDYRPLIQNQKDSVYYTKVFRTWCWMLARKEGDAGLRVRVFRDVHDVTQEFVVCLGERRRAIASVLSATEYSYLYNGILQHSDASHSERYVKDYTSGSLNYTLVKQVLGLRFIREMLRPLYMLGNVLTFPKLGPL